MPTPEAATASPLGALKGQVCNKPVPPALPPVKAAPPDVAPNNKPRIAGLVAVVVVAGGLSQGCGRFGRWGVQQSFCAMGEGGVPLGRIGAQGVGLQR